MWTAFIWVRIGTITLNDLKRTLSTDNPSILIHYIKLSLNMMAMNNVNRGDCNAD
jgi:hypothetical protein